MSDIIGFQHHRWLSNFHICNVPYNRMTYPSVEHAYVCNKSANPFLVESHALATALMKSGQAKLYGRTIPLRSDWDEVKIPLMESLLRIKFSMEFNSDLAIKLIDTGDCHIEEANRHKDDFWGTYEGKGENHLGKLLMKIRSELQADTSVKFVDL